MTTIDEAQKRNVVKLVNGIFYLKSL